MLLLSLTLLARMQVNLFSLLGQNFSVRDLVLIGGGLFLLVKGTMEIHDSVEGRSEDEDIDTRPSAVFMYVILQIAVIDIVFSLDSVITAIGMVNHIGVMVAAIMVAVAVMMFASNLIGDFIDRHPTIKMLALSFIILVGVALIADGFEIHIERKLLYFAMAFSAGVESLNILAKKRQRRYRD
jgi:predicted tellurium resistance membrane protein TerC